MEVHEPTDHRIEEVWCTAHQLVKLYDVSRRTIRSWVRENRIRVVAYRHGRGQQSILAITRWDMQLTRPEVKSHFNNPTENDHLGDLKEIREKKKKEKGAKK